MLNICLIYTKIANLNNSQQSWTQTECDVISSCFESYEFLSEIELVQFGLATHVSRTIEKIVDMIKVRAHQHEIPVNMVTPVQLVEVLNSCVVWFFNLTLEARIAKQEILKLKIFHKVCLVLDVLPLFSQIPSDIKINVGDLLINLTQNVNDKFQRQQLKDCNLAKAVEINFITDA